MAVKISIKPEADPKLDEPPMEDADTEPLDLEGEDDLAGMAADNEPVPSPEPEPEPPALADVVPEANPDVEGRISAIEAQLAAAKARAEEMPQTNLPMESAAEPGDSEWAAFEADYPDIAGPIKKLLEARTQRYGTEMQAVHTRIFEEAMDAARPDWREMRDDPGFGQWLRSHPEQQQAAQVPGVRAALKVLSAYDASRKGDDLAKARAERLKNGEATPAKGARAPSLSDSLDGWAAA